jgi:SAM-dependent methyltransferase/uncharacterized protein YbaR (Trm112 family)
VTIGPEFLETLCCPFGRSPLREITAGELARLNGAIARGEARYAGGEELTEPLDGGLATLDGTSFYPFQEGVPALLPALRIVTSAGASHATDTSPAPPPDDLWTDFWERISRHWNDRQSPSRPAPEDTELLQRLVGEALAGCPAPRALMLGVTPEVATMKWPPGTRVLAIDASPGMIRNVWPAREVPDAAVVRGDWAAMPIRDAAFDIVVGDASIGIQEYPDSFFAVVRDVRRVLKDGGALATRVFTRPEKREPLEAIFADLREGRIPNLDFFRWRVIAALHGNRAAGTRQSAMWDAWVANVPDPAGLIEALGWPKAMLQVMENARGSRIPMIFPTLREFRDDLAVAFEETACEFPGYTDGGRFPTLVFRATRR